MSKRLNKYAKAVARFKKSNRDSIYNPILMKSVVRLLEKPVALQVWDCFCMPNICTNTSIVRYNK